MNLLKIIMSALVAGVLVFSSASYAGISADISMKDFVKPANPGKPDTKPSNDNKPTPNDPNPNKPDPNPNTPVPPSPT